LTFQATWIIHASMMTLETKLTLALAVALAALAFAIMPGTL
jgi:hypothetical protein